MTAISPQTRVRRVTEELLYRPLQNGETIIVRLDSSRSYVLNTTGGEVLTRPGKAAESKNPLLPEP